MAAHNVTLAHIRENAMKSEVKEIKQASETETCYEMVYSRYEGCSKSSRPNQEGKRILGHNTV